jgi:peptide/nickel transport system substrate-binding protein
MRWRIFLTASAFGLAAALAAAEELRIGLSADVTTMDPHFVAAQPNLTVQQHVFEGLVRVDASGRIAPGLAQSWETPDPLTWEIRLRRDVLFHDGSELTAEDVAWSLERPLSIKGSPGGYGAYVRPIVSREVVGRHTLRLRTSRPYGALMQDLAHVLIVSRRAAEGATGGDFDSGRAAVGTGPFRLVRFARGDRVELARHDRYWGGAPPWRKVTLSILPNDPTRTAALLSGALDAIEHVPPADLPRLRRQARFRVEQTVSWRTIFLHLDQQRVPPPGVTDRSGRPLASNPFRDVRVRKAISRAIDREAIATRVMEGLALPAANIISPGVIGHDPAVRPDPYDPAGAKRLMSEAGFAAGFALSIATPNNRYVNDHQVAQAVAQMLARIGIAARVDAMPLSVYLSRARNREFGVALLGWGSLASDLALRSLAATPDAEKGHGVWNWAGYSNPELDRLIERSLATVEPVEREAAARAASALAAREVVMIPLHYQIVTWAMRRGLEYEARTDEFTFAHHFRTAGGGKGRGK